MIAIEANGCRLDTGHITRGRFDEFGLESGTLTPAQIHTQQHLGPILRLGTTTARLNIKKGRSRIVVTGEHATKFELGDAFFQGRKVGSHGRHRVLVVFLARHLQQVAGIAQTCIQRFEDIDDILQRGTLLTKFLGFFRLVPDRRVFELAQNFF